MKKAFFPLLMVIVLVLVACTTPADNSATQPSISDQVGTVVAATMQALSTSTPIPAPTETPIPRGEAFGEIAYTVCNKGDDSFNSCEIYRIHPDGSNPTRLTDNEVWDHSPSWAPDGSRMAFVTMRDGNFEIYVMNADGSDQINLTNNVSMDSEPAWSPDGRKIAFVSDRDGVGSSEIYVMSVDGGSLTRLTDTQDNYSPAWSPDGTKLAYRRDNPASGGIYEMHEDGSNPVLLSDGLFWAGSPTWSPDGTKIAFVTSVSTDINIYVMNADGSGQNQLTSMSANENNPVWSPDGTKIAFESLHEESGVPEIYVTNSDGSGLTLLMFPASLPDW